MSSTSSDAAEQVVRMSLEGVEVAAKITGAAAKQVALLLYSALKDQKKSKGKTRLTNLIRTGKELKVFAVQDKDLATFSRHARQYGILYCVLKDRDAKDSITEVMAKAEDASKISRIFDRFGLSNTDLASIKGQVERDRIRNQIQEEQQADTRTKEQIFLDALLSGSDREERHANPTPARTENSYRSVPSSRSTDREPVRRPTAKSDAREGRRSIRQELSDIRQEMEREERARVPQKQQKPLEHKAPRKKKPKKER